MTSQAEQMELVERLRAKAGPTRMGNGSFGDALHEAADTITALSARVEELTQRLNALVDAKALAGVRRLVAGWNGEHLPEPNTERHPPRLGARIETNCGSVYQLDEALVAARAALTTEAERG